MAAAPLATAWDATAPLPSGRLLLEASAGTGKTHAMAALAIRFLAEGRCTTDQLVCVTFSRSASSELRRRLLRRLEDTTANLIGGQIGSGDLVDEHLRTDQREPVEVRIARLQRALATIDHATITTIHGLCDDLLRRVGHPRLGTLLHDDTGLAAEILGDLYVRAARGLPDFADHLPNAQRHGLAVVRAGMANPREFIVPAAGTSDVGGVRAWIAIAAGQEAASRKANGRLHTYDDLLGQLDELLAGPAGEGLSERLRERFTVALVDEFQDTDPVQWRILESIFDGSAAQGRALVVVADPKQAIYGFRGADILTYLDVRGDRPDRTLVDNWRADEPVVRAINVLFDGIDLGRGIRSLDVRPTHPPRIAPAPAAPVSFRIVSDDAPIAGGRRGPRIDAVRRFVASDVAAHAVDLLSRATTIDHPDDGQRPLGPRDITVLVRTNAQAELVRRQLGLRDVPTVLNGVGNVLDTAAARDWLAVMRALLTPTQGSPARVAALTDLLGLSVTDVVLADDRARDDLHVLLHDAARVMAEAGVAATWRWLDDRCGISPRLRGQVGGSRRLADLLHLTEVLHAEQRRTGHALGSLIGWLEQAIASSTDPPPPMLARRLDDDADAVEIMTIHGAKGLEKGIVLAPFLWDSVGGNPIVLRFTDEATGQRRVDVGGKDGRERDWARHLAVHNEESEEEERRLAYVACTRPRHHLVLWWAASGNKKVQPPLSTLLSRGGITSSPSMALQQAKDLRSDHPDLFDVAAVSVPGAMTPMAPEVAAPRRGVGPARVLGRTIDTGWARYSYSRLSAQATEDEAGEVDASGMSATTTVDEPDPQVESAQGPVPDELGPVVPLTALPGGAEIGSAIHGVLEHVGFADADRRDQITQQIGRQSRGSSVDLEAVEGLLDGLEAVIDTPLGPIAGGRALSDLGRADRLDELAFEFPALAEGLADTPDTLLLSHLASLLRTHLPAGDPFRDYADVLDAQLGHVEVRGYVAGFVDLIARVPDPDGGPDRFLVSDYKTNRVAPADADDLRVGHYTSEALAAEMIHHHYPLQALLYVLATHRYLRWRVADYDPDTHLAGVAYLFIRGMAGRDAPTQADGTPYGVFSWHMPTDLLSALDDLFVDGSGAGAS